MVMGFSLHLLLLFFHLAICSSEQTFPYMTSNVEEVAGRSFDYIVVGGGTAGCPLTATLSEKFSVLLVERGGSPYGDPFILELKYFGFPYLQTNEYTSAAQRFVSTDGVPNFRGRVLGGSAAINAGFYGRASKDFVKKVGWDKEGVKDAYEWVESRIISKPDHLTPWSHAVAFSFLEAGILPYNGFSLEHIQGTKIGATSFDNQGRRHLPADLLPAGNPSKITVLLNATVDKVIFQRTGTRDDKIARGIRFIKSDGSSNQTYEAYLNQPDNSGSLGDVILSAGALGSPQILLLSGIGPQQHLKNFEIPLVLNLKGVGEGMQDNTAIQLFVNYNPQNPTPGPASAAGIADDFKIITEAGIKPISLNGTTVSYFIGKIAFPESLGKLELNSTDPRANPSVTFNYLSSVKDLAECVKMTELLELALRSKSIASLVGSNEYRNKPMPTKDELQKLCKTTVSTFSHYHGGCTMGSVVDKNYRVYGVKGLRVIDGSTFLESPGTNPMATVLMLGRYQGLKILQERKDA
ncbi:putative oxygen-dependent choline dehydrogenase, FAD/NAD(P)-binding domain-containing protein [Rosa chinensis]|uniref:Putative oxygen-dependent choline dehydrogenase, FAD/NAD(P)-binding domain-containing protein n=1 Tax=Rosa chinensis TaxID=74649 RepID=A0A2P6R2U4_ROSCH|nr:(R)-mandelonitrile lyase-like [Rosa chinensis]PRQ40772.1 putative oxygen-dependent choline dehydrogenase, FAD/NAD(P)-binding domain-containing protein [Rosa chinensis]